MFAWLTDVFASSGFVAGEAWAFRRNQQWQELRLALTTWWLVRLVKAPLLWSSAWVARHSKVGPWARWTWLLFGLCGVVYFGPGPVLEMLPWPTPGVVGWLAGLGLSLAFVCYVPRLRGMTILRPLKAAVILIAAYWLYWALTAVTFHYSFGVDVWSEALWEDVEAVWNRGGNLRWSAFWLLVGDTVAWYVFLVILWTRVARVWVAGKLWGVRIVNWAIRAGVLLVFSYTVISFMGVGLWQAVDRLATSLAAFPYGAETVAQAPQWAVAFVLLVFGLIILNLVIIVLETIADILCFITKMFNIVLHGGIINADRYDDEEVEPKRVVGLFERFDRFQHGVDIRYEAYTRQLLINEATSGITDDGFQEPFFDPHDEPQAGGHPKRKHRWWQRRSPDSPDEMAQDEPANNALESGATEPSISADAVAPDDGDDRDEEGQTDDGGLVPIAQSDTSARDSFLAPDSEELDWSDTPPEGTADLVTNNDEEQRMAAVEDTLRAARTEAEQARDEARQRHQDALEDARRQARAQEEFQRYADADGLDMLEGDPEDDDDPFDPNSAGYKMDAETEYEYEAWPSEPEAPSGPFGQPFGQDDEAPEPVDEDDPEPDALAPVYAPPVDTAADDLTDREEEELGDGSLPDQAVGGDEGPESLESGVDASGERDEDHSEGGSDELEPRRSTVPVDGETSEDSDPFGDGGSGEAWVAESFPPRGLLPDEEDVDPVLTGDRVTGDREGLPPASSKPMEVDSTGGLGGPSTADTPVGPGSGSQLENRRLVPGRRGGRGDGSGKGPVRSF